MKKFILILCLLSVSDVAYAIDFNQIKQKAVTLAGEQLGVSVNTNLKQIEKEKEVQDYIKTPEMRLIFHIVMFQHDKQVYDDGGEGYYGRLIKILNDNKTLYTPTVQYAEKAKKLFDTINTYTPDNHPTPAEFDKLKIKILDSDYDKLEDELLEVIMMLNTY